MNQDEPAFSIENHSIDGEQVKGLTKREWFAGMALMGFMAGCPWGADDMKADPKIKSTLIEVAQLCFASSDAMIEVGKQ